MSNESVKRDDFEIIQPPKDSKDYPTIKVNGVPLNGVYRIQYELTASKMEYPELIIHLYPNSVNYIDNTKLIEPST